MRMRSGVLFAVAAAFFAVAGCYDLTFDSDDHLINALSMMAVHAEPPEIRPGHPIDIAVLFADPLGDGRRVWFGWQVDIADLDVHTPVEPIFGVKQLVPGADASFRIPVIWPSERAHGEYDFYAYVRIYLCAGDWHDPGGIRDANATAIYKDVCKNGPMLIATKSLSSTDSLFPQNNPTIDTVLLNGATLIPTDHGGTGHVVCASAASCASPQILDLYIGEGSLEPFGIAMDAYNTDAEEASALSEIDGGLDNGTVIDIEDSWLNWEIIHVDWYATGGALAPNRSVYPATRTDYLGPFRTTWRPDGVGTYTIWAVVRDVRGGNAYAGYRVVVEEEAGTESGDYIPESIR